MRRLNKGFEPFGNYIVTILSRFVFTIIILSLFVFSCSEQTDNENKDLLPEAAGDIAEVLIVIDSAKWAGSVGDFFRESLGAPIPGLPQDEPYFTLRRIDPFKMNDVLKTAKSIIYVTILNDNSKAGIFMRNNVTPESIERIKNEPDLFMYTKQDEYAIGQEITHLFGTNDESLLGNLSKNRDRLMNYFMQIAKDRTSADLYRTGEKKRLARQIANKYKFTLRIPEGYSIADEKDDFLWLRHLDKEEDKSIFVYFTDYTTQEVFKEENLLALREEITSTYLRDIEKPEIYVTYQDILPMKAQATTFQNEFAMKAFGLWKASDNSLGGPYRSYAFVDQKLNRLYYMEAYVTALDRDKREALTEVEVIMSTFKNQSQLENEINS